MKKFVLAMLVMTLVCTGAFATVLSPGLYEGSADVRTNLYRSGAVLPFGTVAVDDEARAIFSVDGLNFGYMSSNKGAPRIIADSGAPYVPNSLAGLLYDIDVSNVSTFGNLLSFSAGTRTSGIWTDTYAGKNGALADAASGAGGLLVIYDDPTPNTMLNGSPGAWVENGAGATTDPSISGTLDAYPTISDDAGEPWLIAVLMPLPTATVTYLNTLPSNLAQGFTTASDTVFYEDVPNGFAIGFANIIGGTAANQFDTDVFGDLLDIRIDLGSFSENPNPSDTNIWALTAQDPIQFSIIPEPASLTLLGLGIAGLIGYRRKRK